MKNWNVIKANVLAFLSLKAEHDKQIDLSAEQKSKLNKFASGGKEPEGDMTKFADVFAEKFNKEIEALADNSEAQKIYAEFLAENQIDPAPAASENGEEDPDAPEIPVADAKSVADAMKDLVANNKKLAETNAQHAANIEKLKGLPEEDVPEAVIQLNPKHSNTVKHSATHLFASNNSWDSLNLPWNKKVIDAQQTGSFKPSASTTWDKVNIDKLNSELGAYSRRNSSEIMSMLMDGYQIPPHWDIISNVQDEYVFTAIATGDVTQAFKKAFLPKNKQRFVPIKNKVYDKQIDISWAPSELKSIEKSWLNMFFNEGSTPYKESFVRYLIGEILKKARKEDKMSLITGVYSNPELQPNTAGHFLNSMNGMIKLIKDNRDVNYKSHSLPTLTPTNTYDVLTTYCEETLPLDFRNLPDLVLTCGEDVHRWYVDGLESSKALRPSFNENSTTIDGKSNIKFYVEPSMDGTGFFYITTEKNQAIMIDRPGEEGIIVLERALRAINGMADYKLGPAVKAFGAAVDPNDPLNYDNQIFFSNDVEVLTDTYVPVEANDATPSLSEHNALKIGGNNTSATDVTNFDNATAGQFVYIYCDDATNAPTIKNNANIVLATGADFTMAKGDKLTLVYTNSKFVEYSRTVASEVALETKVPLDADAITADAADGTWFVTQANTGATAFTNIANAVAGETYTIEGGSNTDSTTIASSGNFLLSASFTASAGAILKVKYNGSKFVEVSRA